MNCTSSAGQKLSLIPYRGIQKHTHSQQSLGCTESCQARSLASKSILLALPQGWQYGVWIWTSSQWIILAIAFADDDWSGLDESSHWLFRRLLHGNRDGLSVRRVLLKGPYRIIIVFATTCSKYAMSHLAGITMHTATPKAGSEISDILLARPLVFFDENAARTLWPASIARGVNSNQANRVWRNRKLHIGPHRACSMHTL